MGFFGEAEIVVLLIISLGYLLAAPITVLAIHLRRFAPLRDVQPTLCILTYLGGIFFNFHLFFAWRHDSELCIPLAVVQFASSTAYFCTFLAKHYVLHRRYAVVAATPLPTTIVWLLCAFPFVVLGTYRVAARTEGSCPNVDGLTGLFGAALLLIAVLRFVLREHPSPHYRRAVAIEVSSVFIGAGTAVVRQFTSNDAALASSNTVLCLVVNAAFLAYVLPPIVLRLQRGDDCNDAEERLVNDSLSAAAQRAGGTSYSHFLGRVVGRLSHAVHARAPDGDRSSNDDSAEATRASLVTIAGADSHGDRRRGGTPAPTGSAYNSTSSVPMFKEGAVGRELSTVVTLIQEGSLDRLERFVMRCGLGVISAVDGQGRTALHHAVRHGDLGIIRFLVEVGADPNHFDSRGHTPLHETVRRRDHQDRSSAITELLRGGALVNLPSSAGLTPLHFAVMHGHLGALNTLLRYDAAPLHNHDREERHQPWTFVHVDRCGVASDDSSRKSPLTVAVELNEDSMTSAMMNALRLRSAEQPRGLGGGGGSVTPSRFTPDFRCPHGLSLLHVALALGNSKVVSVLLNDAGCSARAVHEESGMNAFHFAAIGDNDECVSLLLSALDVPDIMVPAEQRGGSSSASDAAAAVVLAGGGDAPSHHLAEQRFHSGTSSNNFAPSSVGASSPSPLPPQTTVAVAAGRGHVAAAQPGASTPTPTASCRGLHMRGVQRYGMSLQGGPAMGFGQAFAKVKEHVPNFTADASRLTELEAAVDRASQKLRAKAQSREVEALHRAMLIVSKRIRVNSSRSLANLYTSLPPSFQLGASQGTSDAKPMDRVTELLNAVDAARCTPLHYAIQHVNLEVIAVFAAYGAIFVDASEGVGDELADGNGSEGRGASGDRDLLSDDCDLSEASLRRDGLLAGPCSAAIAPPAPATSGSSASSLGGTRAAMRCTPHSRFLLRAVAEEGQRRAVMAAVREGLAAAAAFAATSPSSSGNSPVSSDVFRAA